MQALIILLMLISIKLELIDDVVKHYSNDNVMVNCEQCKIV